MSARLLLITSALSGCFYVGGPWVEPKNRPPVVLSRVPAGEDLVFTNEFSVLWVQARDPDENQVRFTWLLPTRTDPGNVIDEVTDNGTLYTATINVLASDFRDGDVIRCNISDGVASFFEEWTVRLD